MKNYFEGYYFKHQKGDDTLCLIVGQSNSEKFIQVITNDFSKKLSFTEDNDDFFVKGSFFSSKGIILNLKAEGFSLTGKIRYREISPIKYDIMGPFRYFPMECQHGVISMFHRLEGRVILNGKEIDFTNGKGYIEMDSGCSFPSSYVWIQANDFEKPCSIMVSVANIPFYGLHFRGCICVIQYRGKEYRLATYLGVKVILCTKNRIILKQGKYVLDIRVQGKNGQSLAAPINGEMERTIIENASCPAEFSFYEKEKLIFRLKTRHASFEYER